MNYERKLFLIVVALFLTGYELKSQDLLKVSCNLQVTAPMSAQRGGRYITASGTLNVLFVYVQFPDDNFLPSNTDWPKGQAPTFMNATVDAVWSTNPTPGGFTDYFNQMSFNALKITGSSVSVITPHTRAFYLDSGWTRADIQEEVLKQLDGTMDFAQYDHWRYNGEYDESNASDGTVDMILMMWRNICSDTADVRSRLDLVPGGEASLGYYSSHFQNYSFSVDGGLRTIQMGYSGYGSGLTAIDPVGSISKDLLWTYARHEFGHWLLGGNEYHTKLGTWGMVNGWGTPSECANSFERYKLGWMNFTDITDISTTRTISNCTLTDFVTSGAAYRITVPGGGSDEYYLLENHQRISAFDVPDNNVSNAKGVFILLQQNDQGNSVGIVSAEGRYDWTVPYQLPNIYGGSGNLPVFQRGHSNRVGGYSKRQYVPWTWGGYQQPGAAIHYNLDFFTGSLHQAPPTIFTGDGTDQFDLATAPVFTPSSNPSSDLHNNANKIGFEITGVQSGLYTFNIHVNTTINTAPSNPQDVAVTYNSSRQPVVSWTANQESDVTGYDLYRAIYYDGLTPSYTKVNSSPLTSPTFSDNPDVPNLPAGKDVYWRYRVIAIDNQSKYSAPSEDGWVYVGRSVAGTITSNTTWDRNQILVGNVNVNSGTTLTLNPGITVRFANLTSLVGYGPVVANGTQQSPVAFIRANNSQVWGEIYLQAINNQLSYCLIDGSTWGVALLGGTCEMVNCTVRNNSNTGIYLQNATLGSYSPNWLFSANYIHDNGRGIDVEYGGSVYLLGTNKVINNGNSQIYLASTTTSRVWGGGGYNAIYAPLSTWFIYNLALSYDGERYTSWPVPATFDYWGSSSGPRAAEVFYGPVTYSPYLTYDPTDVSGNPSIKGGGVLSKPPILSKTVLSSGMVQAVTQGDTSREDQQLVDVKNRMLALRAMISNAPNEVHTARRINELHGLLRFDPTDKLCEKALVTTILAKYRKDLSAQLASSQQVDKGAQLAGEMAMVLEVQDQVETKDYPGALKLASTYHSQIQNIDNRHELLLTTVAAYEQNGQYDKALAAIGDLERLSRSAKAVKRHKKFILPDYSLRKERLLAQLGGQSSQPKVTEEMTQETDGTGLGQNYPNPFNPTTTIPFTVKNPSNVKIAVYDLLGRRVAELANSSYGTGSYRAIFGGNQVASGTYIVRAEIKSLSDGATQRFQKKIVFLK